MKELILGGARSGKSAYAEQRARELNKPCTYIATALAHDDEMADRIARHQQERDSDWLTIESPTKLAETLLRVDKAGTVIIVDCLTLWLSNCLHLDIVEEEKRQLLQVVPELASDIFLVSNEVGSGIVPLGELSRQFVDHSGWLHQALGKICQRVTLVVAGFPLSLK